MLDTVKSNLKITWDTEDDELSKMIQRGEALLEERAGCSVDFDNNLVAQSLLLNYVRYEYSNSVEFFENNFASEILSLQINEAIKAGELDE